MTENYQAQMTLWYRKTPRAKWSKIMTGTDAECNLKLTELIRRGQCGDWYTGPATVDPNTKRRI